MLKRTLDNSDYYLAAQKLDVEPAAIKAVAIVESMGSGFYPDGFPTILFERHKFYKHAPKSKRDQWFKDDPVICNPKATPADDYGTYSAQRVKFEKALGLDKDAAMKACSWGIFQELGENFSDCGFQSVSDFVNLMKSGAAGHLDIFVRSIKARKLAPKIRTHDWKAVAENYNGLDYKKFHWDEKMIAAFADALKETFNSPA
jgi:N-acetylmuramidase